MALLHPYENYLIRQLPPNAQRAAEALLAKMSLAELLSMRAEKRLDLYLLDQNKVAHELWPDILRAVLLARVSYFEPSPLLDQEKILLLVKLAVETVGFSLSTPLPQIVNAIKSDYPRLTKWLALMAQLLAKVKSAQVKQAAG
ncbi:MAG: hypothetical protein KAZ85_01145 [Gammaproteobacteria bacterium]|nr:hypothetical protein [Gammaproteobacteria bacterium]